MMIATPVAGEKLIDTCQLLVLPNWETSYVLVKQSTFHAHWVAWVKELLAAEFMLAIMLNQGF